MFDMRKNGFASLGLLAGLLIGCGGEEGPVDFDSEAARVVREQACSQDWSTAARKGAGAETYNASTLWSVSPYQVLVPSTGVGFVRLNVDTPHYDWLLYTTADVQLDNLDGPALESNGPVAACPELGLVEYGAHQHALMSWSLQMGGEPLSRARFYAGVAGTDHSDPDEADHAGHDVSDDSDAPAHGDH
jgi:hypothetical protein